jgi:glycosyltransferase involved in cell wall biosynthesis
MKIGIDISPAIYGTGVSDYTINLVQSLIKTDPDNSYVLFGSSLRRAGDLAAIFPQSKLFHFPPMGLHLLWNVLHTVNIESLIGDVDIFHSSDWVQPPSHCPAVTTVHDLSPFLFPSEMKSGFIRNINSVHSARMHWVVRQCKKIICVSKSTADELQKLFSVSDSQIEIIPEALPSRYDIDADQALGSTLLAKYGLSDFLVAIGTPQPRKNISRLVKAFLTYKDRYRLPEKLVIIGGHGWGMTEIPDSPNVIFTGYLPDLEVVALLSQAKAFVYPSLHEGFGLPVLEAFRQKVPVVTSSVSCLPEVAGDAAVLVNPKDEEAIAVGITLAIKDSKRLVAQGTKRLARYSWEETAKKTLLVYSSVC